MKEEEYRWAGDVAQAAMIVNHLGFEGNAWYFQLRVVDTRMFMGDRNGTRINVSLGDIISKNDKGEITVRATS